MNVPYFLRSALRFTVKNSPAILTGLAVVTGWTAVGFAIEAAPKAKIIEEDLKAKYLHKFDEDEVDSKDVPVLEMVKAVGPVYIPTIIAVTIMTGCMIGATSIGSKRSAVLASLYSASEVALKEYQTKVIETIGTKKEQEVRDNIAKARLADNPVSRNEVLITGKGDSLVYEPLSGRYFKSDIEKIRKIENQLNRNLLTEMWVSLNEVYYELGLGYVVLGDDIGWDIDHPLDFGFSSQIADDDQPCLVINFLIPPTKRKY